MKPSTSSGSKFQGSLRRRAFAGLLALIVVMLVGVGAIGWYYSGQLLTPIGGEPEANDLKVLATNANTVTLTANDDTTRPGVFGLATTGGYAQIGAIVSNDGGEVARVFKTVEGKVGAGQRAHIDSFVFKGDPTSALGLPFQPVKVHDDLGAFPAWWVKGKDRTWVIFIHGRGSNRQESLRFLPVVNGLGLPCLDITYRNDPGVPASKDHLYHLGASEWEEVEAAARFALSHGAQHLVLYGSSMGGSIAAEFMRHSDLAGRVRALVLDAPVLSWDAALNLAAEQRGLPSLLTKVAEVAVRVRTGVSVSDLTQSEHVGAFDLPILLWQGTDDDKVTPRSNRAFAEADASNVRFELVPDSGHVQSWNHDPRTYDAEVGRFLASTLNLPDSALVRSRAATNRAFSGLPAGKPAA